MRVLYLCHRVPYPPNKGDKIRAFHELRAIASRHEVDLFTLADQVTDLQQEEPLRQYCRNVSIIRLNPLRARLRTFSSIMSGKPLSVRYFDSAELNRRVQEALARRSYDRIFIFCSSMAEYVRRVNNIPAVLDIVDVDSDKWTQYASFKRFPLSAVYRREGNALRKYEGKLCSKFPIVVTTEREAQLVRRTSKSCNVHVIPNGVDTSYFDPRQRKAAPAEPTIVFVGDMAYFPNEEAVTSFALNVLPLIRSSISNVRFLIVGRDPSRRVRSLERLGGVTVTGSVPDVRPYLARAHASVAPFAVATGIQNKILEALAYGLPVVATPRAAQGLLASVARVVETGRTPEELAKRVIDLLRNPQIAQLKGAEGQKRVADEYNWQRSMDRLLQLLESPDGALVPESELAQVI